MRMFRTMSILVLVFFVVALTAASASACGCKEKCGHKEKCKCGCDQKTVVIVKNEVKPVITVEPEMNNYAVGGGGCGGCGGWGGGCC
jgi:hypothetical protein